MKRLLDHLSRLGSEHHLSFSAQEILKKHVLALDGLRRKLFVLNSEQGSPGSYSLIDLNKVKSCSVKKRYFSIRGGELKQKPLEKYLQDIRMYLNLVDSPPVEVLFYDHLQNNVHEVKQLEKKAKNWETIITKLRSILK